jgi:argonaute-like protein implicated in RNA metabolism and viral defense
VLDPTIYRTQGRHANHYTTDAFAAHWCMTLWCHNKSTENTHPYLHYYRKKEIKLSVNVFILFILAENYLTTSNYSSFIGGVMVSMPALRAVDCGIEHWSGQTRL